MAGWRKSHYHRLGIRRVFTAEYARAFLPDTFTYPLPAVSRAARHPRRPRERASKLSRMPRANEASRRCSGSTPTCCLITGGDAFRARIYERAARAVAGHSADVGQLDAAALRQIPGVGKSIAEKITEYHETGTFRAVEDLRADVPAGVRELTRIPALGPKRALQLYRDLQISSVEELTEAIKDGKLRDLKGFGAEERGPDPARYRDHGAGRPARAGERGHGHGHGHGHGRRRRAGLRALRVRGLAAPDAGDHRRRRHPGRGR